MTNDIEHNRIVVLYEGDQLVAKLPDGRQLVDADPVQLAKQLLSERFSVDQVCMPHREQNCDLAPDTGDKIAVFWRMLRAPTYLIEPRPTNKGGGWRLRLLEDAQEVGGGVFPPIEGIDDPQEALQAAFDDAQGEAQDWMSSRPQALPGSA